MIIGIISASIMAALIERVHDKIVRQTHAIETLRNEVRQLGIDIRSNEINEERKFEAILGRIGEKL